MSKFDSSKLKFEEAKLEIRNLDSDTVTTAGQINDEVRLPRHGPGLLYSKAITGHEEEFRPRVTQPPRQRSVHFIFPKVRSG